MLNMENCSLVEQVVQKLVNCASRGLNVRFLTNGKDYQIYIGSAMLYKLNEMEFNVIYEKWIIAKKCLL